MAPIRYRPDVEQPQSGEEDALRKLSGIFRNVQENVLGMERRARHATHTKATALLKGALVVEGGPPPELPQGSFGQPGRRDALVCFSQGPSEDVLDKASGQRGLSIKALGVEGPHVAGSCKTTIQDWVLGTRRGLHRRQRAGVPAHLPARRRQVRLRTGGHRHSRLARDAEAALEAVGLGAAPLSFFGKPPTQPANDTHFRQAAVRYRDHVAQLSAVPTPETLVAIGDPSAGTGEDDHAFRRAMVHLFAHHDAAFDLRDQLRTDLDAMPVEDASAARPEAMSPHRTVARLLLPRQAAWGEARRRFFGDRLALDPIHALEAHRPLGWITRACMRIYVETQDSPPARHPARAAEPRRGAD